MATRWLDPNTKPGPGERIDWDAWQLPTPIWGTCFNALPRPTSNAPGILLEDIGRYGAHMPLYRPAWSTGPYGPALYCTGDASSAYGYLPHSDWQNPGKTGTNVYGSGFTIIGWGYLPAGSLGLRTFVKKDNSYILRLSISSTPSLVCIRWYSSSNIDVLLLTGMGSGGYYARACYTYNNKYQAAAFNGMVKTQATVSNIAYYQSNPMSVGGSSVGKECWLGTLDLVAIFNQAVDPQHLVNFSVPTPIPLWVPQRYWFIGIIKKIIPPPLLHRRVT